MKKGQMEIIGFMVIVLLLFFGLIIYFQLASKDDSNLLQEAEENLEVSNLLKSIKLYSVCEDTQMGDVIKSCVDGDDECGEDACTLVESEVPEIVAAWGWTEEQYMFEIEDFVTVSDCSGNTFVDDYSASGVSVRLKYCY